MKLQPSCVVRLLQLFSVLSLNEEPKILSQTNIKDGKDNDPAPVDTRLREECTSSSTKH